MSLRPFAIIAVLSAASGCTDRIVSPTEPAPPRVVVARGEKLGVLVESVDRNIVTNESVSTFHTCSLMSVMIVAADGSLRADTAFRAPTPPRVGQ